MAGLKAIKQKIRSTEKTRKVTKAMEAVSAAKMRKAQMKAINGRAYARAATSVLSRVSGSKEIINHPLIKEREIHKALYVVITSDKGLAGSLNSAVLRAVQKDIQDLNLTPQDISIIAIGKKATDFFSNRNVSYVRHYSNSDIITPELINELTNELAFNFTTDLDVAKVDVVKVAYQNFFSTFEQRPTIRTVFPLKLEELQKVVDDIVPVKGAFSKQNFDEVPSVYTVEPSEVEIFNTILPKLSGIFLHHALLESQASEHSARMVSMKSASDKAGEMKHSLTLQFNKARQAAITREVSEITGGMEAMAA